MADIEKVFGTDNQSEVEGRWVNIGGVDFLIARAGGSNTKFANAYAAATRPYQRQISLGLVDEKVSREIMVGPFVNHVLLGWKNLAVKGVEHPYTRENAKKLLLEYPDLFSILIETSSSMAAFKPEDKDAAGEI